ncbi:MAG: 3,4-dehydroadipyl-CoA semialdehyde dehydrogenase [Acidobacteria bacterium]|nr:3,4-dehydroadipyl-CoA semialdehyde dehydrogenase [Acidobacteriota bacterium]
MLENYVSGKWKSGQGDGEPLLDPVLGNELARVSTKGIDMGAALDYARRVGGPALRAMTFAERAKMIDAIAKLFIAKRASYMEIARDNSGNTERDASFDIDGAIGTLRYFAKIGSSLGDTKYVRDGEPFALGRDASLQAIHLATPRTGAAIHINAFNFPAWGTWEKAAVALLAGVPVVSKPAAATALLAWQMVKDVVDANLLPDGAFSLIAGGIGDLLDHVEANDVIAFTGSAATAARVRGHQRVVELGVRVNCEADSLNAIILGPDVADLGQFTDEIVREMTLKSGQKCTAIRRILVPRDRISGAAEALQAALTNIKVGDPRREGVVMGPVVTKKQQTSVREGIADLRKEASVLFEGKSIEADDPERGAFVAPMLLQSNDSANASAVHDIEVFGPVATLMAYDSVDDALQLAARGKGSLVTSIVTADEALGMNAALQLAQSNGRVMILNESVRAANPGHGVVMPSCVHGGPGRAGGGEELGGLRGLWFYLQRTAIQGPDAQIKALAQNGAVLAV